MKRDEGYVKYRSHWTRGPAPDRALTDELERWRRPLYEAGLIGHYSELGIGFGNLSVRKGGSSQFVISGTQTGHLVVCNNSHYTLVTDCDFARNSVSCTGLIQASSEALTHAAIYALGPDIGAVVHVHSKRLWQQLLGQIPTTRVDVSYGTPEMASEFARLYRETHFADTGLAVMAGHEEGLVSMGATLEQAAQRVLRINSDNTSAG